MQSWSKGARPARVPAYTLERKNVATPNYGYEKRQKELAKKQKKEEKLKAKAERKKAGPGGDLPEQSDAPPDAPDAAAGGDVAK
jgi:hypothetical protein